MEPRFVYLAANIDLPTHGLLTSTPLAAHGRLLRCELCRCALAASTARSGRTRCNRCLRRTAHGETIAPRPLTPLAPTTTTRTPSSSTP